MTSKFTINKYITQTDNISTTLTPLTSSKGQILVGDGTEIQQLPVGTDGQILTANSVTSTGLEWTTFTVGPATTFQQTLYFSADLRNGNNDYYGVYTFATSTSSQNNMDCVISPNLQHITGLSIRPAFDTGWWNTAPSQGSMDIEFSSFNQDLRGDTTDFNNGTVTLAATIDYTDVVLDQYKLFTFTGLSITIPQGQKWALRLLPTNWAGGGGYAGRTLITVYFDTNY